MKTEEINACIDRSLVLTNTDCTEYRDVVHRSVVEARAELAALKAGLRYQARIWRNVFEKVQALHLTETSVQVATLWKFMKDAEAEVSED